MSDAGYLQADAEDARAALAAATQRATVMRPWIGTPHDDTWLADAEAAYRWLRSRDTLTPARIVVGQILISDQSSPAIFTPAPGRGPGMPTVITDTQIATYPAAEDVDSKGFEVPGTITLSDDDTAGAIVTRTDNEDGTTSFSAVAPGTVSLTWTDGTLTFTDTLEVDPGAPASIQVGAPVITNQGS